MGGREGGTEGGREGGGGGGVGERKTNWWCVILVYTTIPNVDGHTQVRLGDLIHLY